MLSFGGFYHVTRLGSIGAAAPRRWRFMMCGPVDPVEYVELRNETQKCIGNPRNLSTWLEAAVLRPMLCDRIAELVSSTLPEDKAIIETLRSGVLFCLCPPAGCGPDWSHPRRQALVRAVGEAFGGRSLVPVIAKMDQLWGWECSWVDGLVRPLYNEETDERINGKVLPIVNLRGA